MSTLTSVFGLLPLVLFPGAGSEFYRGLGSVVVLGLSLSAVLTMIIIPLLLALFLGCGPKKLVLEDFEPD
jgi:HAE1 family hydrophobic/amphiphilic exporter-1